MSSKKTTPAPKKAEIKEVAEQAAPVVKLPKGSQNAVNLPIENLKVKKGFNPRGPELGDITELKRNIKIHDLIAPITVCPVKPGGDEYFVISGARRLAACQEIGKKSILSVIRDISIDDPVAYQIAVSENSEEIRTQPDAENTTAAYAKLLAGFGGAGHEAEVAKVAGVSKLTVERALRYNLVPDSIKAKVKANQFTRRTALAVLDIPEEVREKVSERLTAGATENDVRIIANEEKIKLRKAGAAPEAPATRNGKVSRHNVPFGAVPGIAAVERGQRPQADMRRKLTALIINLEADVAEKVEGSEVKLLTAKSALLALYWVAGIISELVEQTGATTAEVAVDAKDFQDALERGKSTVIEAASAAAAPAAAPEKAEKPAKPASKAEKPSAKAEKPKAKAEKPKATDEDDDDEK